MSENDFSCEKKWYKKRENYLIIFGFIVVITAVITPFSIMYFNDYGYNLTSFSSLGSVGDFFGGTTVGLLTLASLIFVTAAMFMQKEELELQRKEVRKNREEYKRTNNTMEKQSFDSTFFNLINLHHSIVENVEYEKETSRAAIDALMQNSKAIATDKYRYFKFKNYTKGDTELKDLLCEAFDEETRSKVHQELFDLMEEEGETSIDEVDFKMEKILDEFYDLSIEFKEDIDLNCIEYDSIRRIIEGRFLDFNIDSLVFSWKEEIIEEIIKIVKRFKFDFKSSILKDDYKIDSEEWKEYKKQVFKEIWEKNKFNLEHFIKNIYTTVDYIENAPNSLDKNLYFNILNSQLSINEKALVYYYNEYIVSKKNCSKFFHETSLFEDLGNRDYLLWIY